MILTCPSCGTRYQTDSSKLTPPGRNVRCAKCGEVWFQNFPVAETDPEPEAEPVYAEPAPLPAPVQESFDDEPASPPPSEEPFVTRTRRDVIAATPVQPKSRRWRKLAAPMAAWLALFVIVAFIGWAGISFRETIASLWPQSASLYAAIGMPVNVRGVALADVKYEQQLEDGQAVLSVTGKVVNVSTREMAIPEVRVILFDASKHELYHWTFDIGVPRLKPGAEAPFTTRLASPPSEARNLNVRFSEPGEEP